MAGWQSCEGYWSDLHVFGPVQLVAAICGYAKTFKDVAYAERGNPARLSQAFLPRKALNRACAEVVVVIVRDEDDVDRWQIFECKRRRVKALRTGPLCRGCAFIPDGIDENTNAVDFNQRRGMPQPRDAQAGYGEGRINARICAERSERMFRRPRCGSEEKTRAH